MLERVRLNFTVAEKHGFLIVRPIGTLPPEDLVDAIIDAYMSVEAPWRYNRIIDFRRYKGYLDDAVREAIGRRWSELTAGIDFHASIGLVFRAAHHKLRSPEVTSAFPNETLCYFTDYHEAVGWLMATDRDAYLRALPELPASQRGGHSIVIE